MSSESINESDAATTAQMAQSSSASIPDGWQECLTCKKVGIRDCFYGKHKRFCSSICSRLFPERQSLLQDRSEKRIIRRKIFKPKRDSFYEQALKKIPRKILQLESTILKRRHEEMLEVLNGMPHANYVSSIIPLINFIRSGLLNQVNTLNTLFEYHSVAPVHAFAHAPLKDVWLELLTNRVIVDISLPYKSGYWRAEIDHAFGYFLKMRYLGISQNLNAPNVNNSFLVNIRLRELLPMVQRNENGRILRREYCPPAQINKFPFESLFTLPKSCSTLDCDLNDLFQKSLNLPFDKNCLYEVIDHNNPSRMLCCKIITTFGDWLGVRYEYGPNKTFTGRTHSFAWVHPQSGFFRVMGWSQLIGYPMYSTSSYMVLSLYTLTSCSQLMEHYLENPKLFPFEPNTPNPFQVGSYLEFLDPFSHKMKIAIVHKILRFGFMVLEYNFELDPNGNRQQPTQSTDKVYRIFQHVTSRAIFPVGFCQRNDVPLYINNSQKYNPDKHVVMKEEIEANAAPNEYFPVIKNTNTLFKPMALLETFNMLGKGLISYAIVDRIVDRLVSLRFINHYVNLELWVEHTSPHLRPFGFTQIIKLDDSPFFSLFVDNLRFSEMSQKLDAFKEQYCQYQEQCEYRKKMGLDEDDDEHCEQFYKPVAIAKEFTNKKLARHNGSILIGPATRPPSNPSSLICATSQTTTKTSGSDKRIQSENEDDELSISERALQMLNVELLEESTENGQEEKDILQTSSSEYSSSDENESFADSKMKQLLELRRKTRKMIRFKKPVLTDEMRLKHYGEFRIDPFRWSPEQVVKFFKNNLAPQFIDQLDFDDFNLNGRQFLRMDHNDFFHSKLLSKRPSMSLALRLNLLRISLIKHLKLNLYMIYPEENDSDISHSSLQKSLEDLTKRDIIEQYLIK